LIASLLGDSAPFWAGAAVSLATVILTALTLDETLTAEERLARRERARKLQAADVIGNPALVVIMLIGFAAQFSFSLFQSTFALFGEVEIFAGYSPSNVSLGIGLMLTGIGIGQFVTQIWLIQPLVLRFGERWLVVLGTALRAFSLFSLVVLSSPWLIGAVSMVSFAVGSGVMMPSLQSLATMTTADDLRGGVLGVYQSSTSLGIILGSALGGVLFAQSHTLPYLTGGAILAVLTLPALWLARREVKPVPATS
jgi:predicted MFS family arabinose efflux permease